MRNPVEKIWNNGGVKKRWSSGGVAAEKNPAGMKRDKWWADDDIHGSVYEGVAQSPCRIWLILIAQVIEKALWQRGMENETYPAAYGEEGQMIVSAS